MIVGAGPIGLAAACAAQDEHLHFLLLDKAGPCQSIVEYAPRQSFYSPADELEVGQVPFPLAAEEKPRREDALAYYRIVAASRKLPLHTWERAVGVERGEDGSFRVHTVQQPDAAWERTYRTRFVLLANGVWDQPRGLDVPGAGLKKVTRRYVDPTPYYSKDCLTIGGGNSAAEVAMALARVGARSRMAMLEPSFDACGLRPFVLRELLILVEEKKIEPMFGVEVTEVMPIEVRLRHLEDGGTETIPNDFVFTMIGQDPDLAFLENSGVAVDPETLRPVHNEDTYETNVHGLYVAGSLADFRHNIVNGRHKAVEIAQEIAARLRE